jgi:hypothetical protein
MVREMERESKRQARVRQQEIAQREREARQNHKENQKQMALEAAKLEVARFENEIELLLSFHKETVDPVDWDVQLRALPSALPYRVQFEALQAEREQIFKAPSTTWESIVQTRQSSNDGASSTQPPQLPRERCDGRQLAREVLKGDEEAYIEAINQFSSLDEIQESGCELDLIYHDRDRFEVVLQLAGLDVIPLEEKNFAKTGKHRSRKWRSKSAGNFIRTTFVAACCG